MLLSSQADVDQLPEETQKLKHMLEIQSADDNTESDPESQPSEIDLSDHQNLSTLMDDQDMQKLNLTSNIDIIKYEEERAKKIKRFQDKLKPKEHVRIIESDFLKGEEIEIPNDVYNLTIAANMTQACSPVEINYALKQCVLVFLMQIFIAFFWTQDF